MFNEDELCMCCCCLCDCSNQHTRDLSCFGCFPIKCAVVAIGIFFIFSTILIYAEVFWMINTNDIIHWWYVLVSIVLLIPMCIGAGFFVAYFADKNETSRARLATSCILAIISAVLYAIWTLTYFLVWYKG